LILCGSNRELKNLYHWEHFVKRSSYLIVVSLISSLWLGCGPGGPNLIVVSGDVRFDGEPVSEGTVTFFSKQSGAAPVAELNTDGHFEFTDGIPAGDYAVVIAPPFVEQAAGVPITEAPKEYPNIPQKYRSDTTSDLKATITDEKFEPLRFELTP